MSDSTPILSQKKLPIWPTLREAMKFWWDHWAILWLWILLGALLEGINSSLQKFLLTKESGIDEKFFLMLGEGALGIIICVPGILVFIFLAIASHRLILLENEKGTYHEKFTFSQRECDFFWYLLCIYVGLGLLWLPGMIIFEFSIQAWGDLEKFFENRMWLKQIFESCLFLIPYIYFVGRYCLVFPAIAVDMNKKYSWQRHLDWSWKISKRNAWRLALLVGGLPLLLDWVPNGIFGLAVDQWVYVDAFVRSFLWFAFVPFEVAVLSIAFRELTNWTPSSQIPEPTIYRPP